MTNYVPISTEDHRDKRWVRHTSLMFAKAETISPLYVNELAPALQAMPIAFIKQDDGFALVVVMGVRPSENLFISGTGAWMAPYVPIVYRSSPFELWSAYTDGNHQEILCIDDTCVRSDDEGEPFFNEDGQVSDSIRVVMDQVKQLNASRQLTQLVCAALAEHDLIVPWPIVLKDSEEDRTVNGLYQIDETALNNLSNDAFAALRKVGALPVAYSQLLSMINISILAGLVSRPELYESAASSTGQGQASDTFDFAGL